MSDLIIHIENNKVLNKAALVKAFWELKDGTYILNFKPYKKRSLSQNAYYHSCIVPIVLIGLKDVGFDDVETVDDAHEILKGLFLKHQYVGKRDGLILDGRLSTTKLSTVEFNEYKEKIQKWALEYLGVVIPDPSHPIALLYSGDQLEGTMITIIEPINDVP